MKQVAEQAQGLIGRGGAATVGTALPIFNLKFTSILIRLSAIFFSRGRKKIGWGFPTRSNAEPTGSGAVQFLG